MFYKIDVRKLCPGMYIVDSGVSWFYHPYLYSTEGELTEEGLASLLEAGYTEAYIDLYRCMPGTLPPELEALLPSISGEDTDHFFLPSPPEVEFEEELPMARMVFHAALNMVKNMMDSIRKGQDFDVPSVEPLVENIINSLKRNADALFTLCKLRNKDDYTYTHCVNVSVISTMFAHGLGMSYDVLQGIGLGALFHDVGKALIPLRILQAPRPLNDAEMDVVKRHPQLGAEYMQSYKGAPKEVFQITLEHHEQYCGKGYPKALESDSISMPGRIAAVVDVFDALSSKRVYKDAISPSKALSIIYSMREKEFFPGMAERFIRLLGVYPVGSAVELEDGSRGVVYRNNPAIPTKPTVVFVNTKNSKKIRKTALNLSKLGAPAIRRIITADELGMDPGIVLGLPR